MKIPNTMFRKSTYITSDGRSADLRLHTGRVCCSAAALPICRLRSPSIHQKCGGLFMHVAGFTGASQCVACTRASLVGFQSAINFSSAAYEFTSNSFATTMSPRVLTIAFQELVRFSCRTYEKSAIFGSPTNVIAVELAGIEPVRTESYAMHCQRGLAPPATESTNRVHPTRESTNRVHPTRESTNRVHPTREPEISDIRLPPSQRLEYCG